MAMENDSFMSGVKEKNIHQVMNSSIYVASTLP